MRIQETSVVDSVPDPRFWWSKTEKKNIWNFVFIFFDHKLQFIKKCNLLY